jgi:hypothetical protein
MGYMARAKVVQFTQSLLLIVVFWMLYRTTFKQLFCQNIVDNVYFNEYFKLLITQTLEK